MIQYRPESIEKLPSSVSVLTEVAFYLIKIYTFENEALFGTTANGCLELSNLGQIAADEWVHSSYPYHSIELDQWLIRPNHLEGIVSIQESQSSNGYVTINRKPRLLSSFIASYKAAAAKRINLMRNAPGCSVWQRSYQERLIPDEIALRRVRQMLLRA